LIQDPDSKDSEIKPHQFTDAQKQHGKSGSTSDGTSNNNDSRNNSSENNDGTHLNNRGQDEKIGKDDNGKTADEAEI
jgi:hypothetical protein